MIAALVSVRGGWHQWKLCVRGGREESHGQGGAEREQMRHVAINRVYVAVKLV